MYGYNTTLSIIDPVRLSMFFKMPDKHNSSRELMNIEDITKYLKYEKMSVNSDDRFIVKCSAPSRNKLENEAYALFGTMRNATSSEIESIDKYVDSISKPTGVDFFDIC